MTENFLYYPPIVKAKELLDAGAIGEPSLVRIHTTRVRDIVGGASSSTPTRWSGGATPGGTRAAPLRRRRPQVRHRHVLDRRDRRDLRDRQPGADFLQETPERGHWRFKDRECLGIIDYTYAPEMPIRSRYYRADEFFEIHGSRGIIWVTRCTGEMLDLRR